MAANGFQDPHLRATEEGHFERRRIFDDLRALKVKTAQHLGDAQKTIFVKPNLHERAAAVDAEATGVSVELLVEHLPVEKRSAARQRETPARHIAHFTFRVI